MGGGHGDGHQVAQKGVGREVAAPGLAWGPCPKVPLPSVHPGELNGEGEFFFFPPLCMCLCMFALINLLS